MRNITCLLLIVTILSVPMTASAATDTAQIMNTVSKYMTPQYAINPTKPMVNEQTNAANIYIYKLPTNPVAYVFTSSAAIDCDGQASSLCNNDPTNLGQTSFTQTNGKPLAPATLPWYVLPETPNPIFDYAKFDIQGGQAGLVLYNNKMEYGVFGDERGRDVGNSAGTAIGEVSYAMAVSLGIPSDPDTGGVDNGVTYIVFTSKANVVSPIESHAAADTIGTSALNIMMSQLGTPVVTPTPTPVVTPYPEKPKTGDINGDGKLTLVDAIYLAKHVGGFSGYEIIYADGDINANGKVTLLDAAYLAKHVGGFIGYETIY